MAGKAKASKKGRKKGRKSRSPAQARYNAEQRWIKNKIRRVRTYSKNNPNDLQAQEDLKRLETGKGEPRKYDYKCKKVKYDYRPRWMKEQDKK